MKKINGVLMLGMILFAGLLSVHILRLDDGFEIITKDALTLRDTYADVRNWGLSDYLSHSPRIRNYLIHEKHYPKLTALIKESCPSVGDIRSKLREMEKSVHEWLSEKLK